MKKLILGAALCICGVIVLCANYATDTIVGAIPGVTVSPGAGLFSLTAVGAVLLLAGLVVLVLGWREN